MLTDNRKEEIREMAISALNSMGSHFFYREIDVDTREEAEYARDLWPGKSNIIEKNGKFTPGFKVGYRA